MTTRGYRETRYCPAPDCERAVRGGGIMCAAHWRRVPAPLRRAVQNAWRTWAKEMTDEAWEAFLDARADALNHVGATP